MTIQYQFFKREVWVSYSDKIFMATSDTIVKRFITL